MNLSNEIKKIQDALKRVEELHTKLFPQIQESLVDSEKWNLQELVTITNDDIAKLKSQANTIDDKINRPIIKISMFGGTSVGKSQVCNAIIGETIFEGSTAHRTSCFVQVQSDDDDYSLRWKDKNETFSNIEEFTTRLNKLTDASEKDALNPNDTLYIGIKDCSSPILQSKKVVLLDTPGVNNKTRINKCVEKEALDSDIFLFVLNYCLSDEDKRFFKYQSEESSKPDVFILINKWDNSDDDKKPETLKSKISIESQCLKFLELQGNLDGKSRISFISAREINKINDKELVQSNLTENQNFRYQEFEKFTNYLKNYIENPEQNKKRVYRIELEKINRIIQEKKSSIKKLIMDLKPFDSTHKYGNIVHDLQKLQEKITTFVNERKNRMDVSQEFSMLEAESKNSQFVTVRSETILERTLNKLQKISDDTEALMKTELKNIFEKHNNIRKKQKIQKHMIEKNIDATLPLKECGTNRTEKPVLLNAISPLIGAGVKSMWSSAAIAAGAFALEKFWNHNTDTGNAEKNETVIRSKKKEIEKFVDDQITDILQHFKTFIDETQKNVEEIRNKYQDYWSKIEGALDTFN